VCEQHLIIPTRSISARIARPKSVSPSSSVVASAGGEVAAVVDHEHPAHADLVEELDERDLRAERLYALDVHADREPPLALAARSRRRPAEQVRSGAH
jgi:hypothetical protein